MLGPGNIHDGGESTQAGHEGHGGDVETFHLVSSLLFWLLGWRHFGSRW
jgi:hypothetical protein